MSERHFFGTAEELDDDLHMVRLALYQWLRTGAKPSNVESLISDLRNRDIKRRNAAAMKTNAQELQELIASTRKKAFEDVAELVKGMACPDGVVDMPASEIAEMILAIDEEDGFKDEGKTTFYTETK